MKKLKYVLLLCLFAIVTTGCVKFKASMDIKKDKSMDFSIIYAFDKSLMGDSSSLKEEDFEDLKKEGYTVEKYSEGSYEGFKIIKKINNIDEVSTDKDVEFNLSGMMEENEDNKYMFKVVKDGDKSTYYAKFKFESNTNGLSGNDDYKVEENEEISFEDDQNLPDETTSTTAVAGSAIEDEQDSSDSEEEITTIGSSDDSSNEEVTTIDGSDDGSDFDLSALANSMDLTFDVSLPSSAISSNSTIKENDNKKLSWKLNYSGTQTIEFAFVIDANAKDDSNMLLYIGIGAGVLLLLVLVFLFTRKKGNKRTVPVNENQVNISNDANENVVAGPELKEETQVVNNEEQNNNV